LDQLGGWSLQSFGQGYGKGYQRQHESDMLKLITF